MGSCATVLDRRISKGGMVAVRCNHCSMPDTKRRRIVEVQSQPAEVRIVEDGNLIAGHQVLESKNRRWVDPSHRQPIPLARRAAELPSPPADAPVARALETLERTLCRLEKREISTIVAIDELLAEELSLREGNRIGVALRTDRGSDKS